MRVEIKTQYVLYGPEGEMFNEVSANVEADCGDVGEFESLVDRHMEREGTAEKVIRTQLRDLIDGEYEHNDLMDEPVTTDLK